MEGWNTMANRKRKSRKISLAGAPAVTPRPTAGRPPKEDATRVVIDARLRLVQRGIGCAGHVHGFVERRRHGGRLGKRRQIARVSRCPAFPALTY